MRLPKTIGLVGWLFATLLLCQHMSTAQSIRFSEFYDHDLGAGGILNIVPLDDEELLAQGTNFKNGARQSHTIHLNSNGGLLNTDVVAGTGIGYDAFGLIRLADGQIVGAGSLCDYNAQSPSPCDFYFTKFDEAGNSVFTQVYERTDTCDLVLDMVQTRPNKIMLIGWTCNDTTQDNTELMFITVDTLGNELNRVVWGGGGTDYVHSGLAINEFGEVLMTGGTQSFGGNDYDTWLVKTDSIGNVLWHETYNGISSGGGGGTRVMALPDGNFAIVGGVENMSTGNSDALLMKVSPMGDEIWTKKYVAPVGSHSFWSGAVLEDGSIVACGQTTNTDDDSQAGWLVKTDQNGDTLWTRTYNPSDQIDRLLNMILMPNGDIVMVGSGRPEGQTNQDGWILRVDSMGCEIEGCFSVGVEELQDGDKFFMTYPNPIQSDGTLSVENLHVTNNVVLEIFDITGSELGSVVLTPATTQISMGQFRLKAGHYIYRIVLHDRVISNRLIVK